MVRVHGGNAEPNAISVTLPYKYSVGPFRSDISLTSASRLAVVPTKLQKRTSDMGVGNGDSKSGVPRVSFGGIESSANLQTDSISLDFTYEPERISDFD